MKNNEEKYKLFYYFLSRVIAPLSLKIFVKKINNFENLNHNKSFIIASNHTSFLDPFIMASIYTVYFNKKLYYIGKKQLFRTLPSRIFHEAGGTIPLGSEDKGKSALSVAKKYLKNGKIIGIFPEGTRSPHGRLLKAKTGVARLALSSKMPVLPIAIKGTFYLMPIGKVIPKFKRKVIINVGNLIYFDKYYKKRINKRILQKITNKIMINIKNLARYTNLKR